MPARVSTTGLQRRAADRPWRTIVDRGSLPCGVGGRTLATEVCMAAGVGSWRVRVDTSARADGEFKTRWVTTTRRASLLVAWSIIVALCIVRLCPAAD